MFTALWAKYKWTVYAGLFLIVAAGSWNIASSVKGNEYNAERIRLLKATIEAQKQNDKLKSEIESALLENRRLSKEAIQEATRETINEILSDPVYKSCAITPGVRNAYSNAIKAQSRSGKSTGAVPSPKGTPVR